MAERSRKAVQTIRFAAMNLLARREHCRYELSQKLASRFPDDEAGIGKELDRLEAEGLLSDERFVESFIVARVRRGQGRVKVVAELRHRKIEDSLVQAALGALNIDWFEQARMALVKRFGTTPVADIKERSRRMRFLQQRGFAGDEIQEALSNVEAEF